MALPRMRVEAPRQVLLIRVDSREQLPIDCWPNGITSERATLTVGDYDTPVLAGIAAIERKSASDFLGSITHDRERFERELVRAQTLDAFAIVVESSLEECLINSAADWRSVIGSIASFGARGFATYFVGSRLASARLIAGLLRRWEERLLPRKTPLDHLVDAADRVGPRLTRWRNGERMTGDQLSAQLAWMADNTAPCGGDPDPNDPRSFDRFVAYREAAVTGP